MKQIKIITIALLILFSRQALGQNADSLIRIEQYIDSIAKGQMETFEIPGLAIGLIIENEVIYAKGFGVQSLDSKIPVSDSSLFHMASVSKLFVATAVMQLVEEGKISLDSLLTSYIPYFRMADERYKEITIRQILSHSSGMPDVKDYEWDKPQFDDLAAEKYVKSFTDKQLKFKPGAKFSYSNIGYDILADLISKVSGLTFEHYMKQNIFEPIGMNWSTFFKLEVPEHLATSPHNLNDKLEMSVSRIYPYNRIHAPSSTLHSNIHDMIMWAQLYLNKGKINNRQIIQESTYKLLTTPQLTKGRRDSICLGWHAGYMGDKRMFYHTGGDVGYNTFFAFIPEDKAAVFVMGNNRLFWGGNPAHMILNKIFFNKNVDYWIPPIHYKLRHITINDGIDKFKEQYFYNKANNPEAYQYNDWCLNELGYWLIERKQFLEAIDILKFNIELNPNNAGYHDSLGDAYRAAEDKENAIIWYEKALAIKPDKENTRKKIKELMKEY
jgi:CubicO group peptidase (beta-lactamase class C family)